MQAVAVRPTLIVAAAERDLPRYTLGAYDCVPARNNVELAALLIRNRPTAVAIDADLPGFDALAACEAARRLDNVRVLVTVAAPEQVPTLLKAGCHSVLVKPFSLSLLAGRIGRLSRGNGTNHAWRDVTCPTCAAPDAVGFDFTSLRRMWFACLGCEHVWIGERQEEGIR